MGGGGKRSDHVAEVFLLDAALNASEDLRLLVLARLEPADFSDPRHALIARAILKAGAAGGPPSMHGTLVALADLRPDQAADVGGYVVTQFLAIGKLIVPYFSPDETLEVMKRLRALRRSRDIALKVETEMATAPAPGASAEAHEAWLARLASIKADEESAEDSEDLADRVAGMDTSRPSLFRSGFKKIDLAWAPRRKHVTVLAGSTSTGKSALALQLSIEAARKELRVLFLSQEMSAEDIAYRTSRIVTEGVGSEKDLGFREEAASRTPRGIVVKDKCRTVDQIHSAVSKEPFDLMVVDYLQLVTTGGAANNYERREREVAAISHDMAEIAKDRNLHSLVLSQLSREHQKAGRAPELYDLRESGSVEQDADNVLLLYAPDPKRETIRVLRLAKNRGGGMANTRLMFVPEKVSFVEIGDEN